jgi:hypothetical protein
VLLPGQAGDEWTRAIATMNTSLIFNAQSSGYKNKKNNKNSKLGAVVNLGIIQV